MRYRQNIFARAWDSFVVGVGMLTLLILIVFGCIGIFYLLMEKSGWYGLLFFPWFYLMMIGMEIADERFSSL